MRTTSSPPFSEEEETLLAEEEVDESEEGQYISVVVVNRFRLTNIGYRNLEQWARAIITKYSREKKKFQCATTIGRIIFHVSQSARGKFKNKYKTPRTEFKH